MIVPSQIRCAELDRISRRTTERDTRSCISSVVRAGELNQAFLKKPLDSTLIYDIFFLCT